MSNHYQDDPSKYIEDNTLTAKAMMEANALQRQADEAKSRALAVHAKEEAQRAEIARSVEIGVANNPQLQAQRMGIGTGRVIRSQDVGMIAPPEVVRETALRYHGIEVSAQQAKDMVENGQWDRASYGKALSDALAQRGYEAPGSFR